MIVKWLLVITLYNPAADKIGQYKVYPFDSRAACEEKAAAHMKVHNGNEIPVRYVHVGCHIYQVTWN